MVLTVKISTNNQGLNAEERCNKAFQFVKKESELVNTLWLIKLWQRKRKSEKG